MNTVLQQLAVVNLCSERKVKETSLDEKMVPTVSFNMSTVVGWLTLASTLADQLSAATVTGYRPNQIRF